MRDVNEEEIFTVYQESPFPGELSKLVIATKYKPNWKFWLDLILDRGQGSRGMTLVIQIITPDSYHPETMRTVNHYFPVPPAAYDMRSWRRWLFDQILLVERHEAMEFFSIRDDENLPDVPCSKCSHARDMHDGRNSSCSNCVDNPHRFSIFGEDAFYIRPFAPSHGPGNDPYLIREVGTQKDVQTSYLGKLRD